VIDDGTLEKYLLKSLCNDLSNMLILNLAMNQRIPVKDTIKTPSDQNKIVTQLPPSVATALQKLISSKVIKENHFK
jgi:hypothetical protein